MEEFGSLGVVRELSCRLCLSTDVVKLKPMSLELKRKLRKIFNIDVRNDDCFPKAICHDCLQQVGQMHRYCVQVAKTQNFLQFYNNKGSVNRAVNSQTSPLTDSSAIKELANGITKTLTEKSVVSESHIHKPITPTSRAKSPHFSIKPVNTNKNRRKTPKGDRHRESLSLEEFIMNENIDETLFLKNELSANPNYWKKKPERPKTPTSPRPRNSLSKETLDPIVIIDGKAAKTGQALDNQISLFYKMECVVCHQNGFQFKTLMKHYRDRHGVPGYVTCCNKKFHYFHPKKIIEHMAYHLQPDVFRCESCLESFQSSQELSEHRSHGGRKDGRILCRRCEQRFPTWRELGRHLVAHRATDGLAGEGKQQQQCDYCGKWLKHHHRMRKVNGMEDLILCVPCIRSLRLMDKHMNKEPNKIDCKEPKLPKSITFSPLSTNCQ